MADPLTGLQTAIAQLTGQASDLAQHSATAVQSARMLLEQVNALGEWVIFAPTTLLWFKEFPSGVYPTPKEWEMLRQALKDGAVILADVGLKAASLVRVRFASLAGESGEPPNALARLEKQLDLVAAQPICPQYGTTPGRAIWRIWVYGTRSLGG